MACEETEQTENGADAVPNSKNGIGTRISEISEMLGGRKKAAAAAGVAVSTFHRWITGDSIPALDSVARLTRAAGVSLDWVAFGNQGENHSAGAQKLTGEGIKKMAGRGAVRERPVMRVLGDDDQALPKYSLEYIAHGEGELRMKPSLSSSGASPTPHDLYAALAGPLVDHTSSPDERKWVMLTALDIVRAATDGDREAMAQLSEEDLAHAVLLALRVRKIWLEREAAEESRKEAEEELRQLGNDDLPS